MVWVGMLLMILGFALVMPRGTVGGFSPGQNIRLAPGQLSRTPGYGEAPTGRARLYRFLAGALLLAGGLAVVLAVS